jgi:hypothetical protein
MHQRRKQPTTASLFYRVVVSYIRSIIFEEILFRRGAR